MLALLHNKGHSDIQPMESVDPVRVNIVAKKNEEVSGSADDTRNTEGAASVY